MMRKKKNYQKIILEEFILTWGLDILHIHLKRTQKDKIHGNPAKLYFVFIKTNPPNI